MDRGQSTIPDAGHPGADLFRFAVPGSPLLPSLSNVPFSPQLAIARYLDGLTGLGNMEPFVREQTAALGSPLSMTRVLAAMPENYRRELSTRLPEPQLSEVLSLGEEKDPEFFLRQMLLLERRFADSGLDSLAYLTSSFLSEMGSAKNFAASTLISEAQRDREALEGTGAVGPRAEYLLKRFVKEATDPAMLVGFGVASMAFKTTRFLALARLTRSAEAGLFTRGFGAGFAASVLGFSAEVPTFVLSSKATREVLSGPQDWRGSTLRQELASTGITLLFLKGSGAVSQSLAGSVAGKTSLARFTQRALPQVGMFGGILLGKRVEELLGLKPVAERGQFFLDSLATYFQFAAGGALADQVLGPRFQSLQRELDIKSAWLERQSGSRAFPGLGGGLAVAGNRAGARPSAPSLEEIVNAPLLMQNNDGGKNGGKVLAFPSRLSEVGAPETAGSEEVPPDSPRTLTPEQHLEEIRAMLRNESQHTSTMLASLRSVREQVQVLLGHALRGRAGTPEFAARRQALLQTYDVFLERYLALSQEHDENQVPLAARDAKLQAEVGSARAKARRFLERARGLHQSVVKLFDEISVGDPERIQAASHELNEGMEAAFQRLVSWAPSRELSAAQEVLMEKVTGMVRGLWVKDIYRGTPEENRLLQEQQLRDFPLLQQASPRGDDSAAVDALLGDLHSAKGRDRDLGQTLLTRLYPNEEEMPDEITRESNPREGLRRGGEYRDPFRSWIGVHLPTLLAAYSGDAKALTKQLASVEIFQTAETRQANALALWWLDRALHSSCTPAEWARQWNPKSPSARIWKLASAAPDRAKAEAVLGKEGDMAAVGHALLAFLRHSERPRAALEEALGAPEAIREDAVSLTGSLLGAYHGKSVFSHDWLGEALLKTVPTRPVEDSARRFMVYTNRELNLAHTQDLLEAFLFGDPKIARTGNVIPIHRGKEIPVPSSFLTGFDERYTNGELVAVGAIWESAMLLGFAEGDQINPEDLRIFRSGLEESIQRMEAAAQSLRNYGREVGSVLKQTLGKEAYAQVWSGLTPKIDRLEDTVKDLRRLRVLTESPAANFNAMRELVLRTVDRWDVPRFSDLKLQMTGGPLPEEAVRVLQEGALLPGRAVRPRGFSPLFDKRSDEEAAQVLLETYRRAGSGLPPSAEGLMELYLRISGDTARGLHAPTGRISPSALFSVLTPAYLRANLENPTRALRELVSLRSSSDPELRESWRVTTYLAIRLAEGAEPNLDLLSELKLSFSSSSMVAGLATLHEMVRTPDSPDRTEQLRRWEASRDMRDQTLLGLYAFFTWPKDPLRAWDAVNASGKDDHDVASRVAGMLSSLGRYRASQTIVAPPKAEVLGLDGDPMKESEVAVDEFEKEMEKVGQPYYWHQAIAEKLEGFLDAKQREELARGLRHLEPQLVRVLAGASENYSDEAFAAVLHDLGVIRLPNRAQLAAISPEPILDQSYESKAQMLVENYPSLFKRPMPVTRAELEQHLRNLPEASVYMLGFWSHDAGTLLLLAKRLGLPGLPEEKILRQAYERWLNTSPPDSEN